MENNLTTTETLNTTEELQLKDIPEDQPQEELPEIKLHINLLKTADDLKKAERLNNAPGAVEVVAGAKDQHWKDLWESRQDFIKAGIGKEGVVAIEGIVTCTLVCRIDAKKLAEFTRDFMREQFGDGNVLSCTGGSHKKTFCHMLIYPLNIRQLNPNRWTDSRSGQFKKQIVNDYISRVANTFGVNLSSSLQTTGNGHTQYLDEKPMVVDLREDVEEIIYDTLTEFDQIQTDAPKDKVADISSKTIRDFTTGVEKSAFIKYMNRDFTLAQYLDEARQSVKRIYPELSEHDVEVIVSRVESAASGYYVLDPLINDKKISDIKVVSPYKIRVKVEGKRRTSNLHFIDDADYARFIDGIMQRNNCSKDKLIHVFTDIDTNPKYILRNNITLQGVTLQYPTYHIRKVPRTKYTIDDLIKLGVMDKTVANYLIWAAREAKGIVFTGKGSSGKTTMMNTLLEYTPSNASGLVIQESDELFSSKPEMTFEHITDQYDLKDLARNGLLTDIDYFIIGEVKGGEAMYFINACDTGNKGWCSVHSPSSTDAIDKLADYVMYESKYDKEQSLYMLKELQVIVFMKNFHVAEISEVTGWDPVKKTLTYKTVLRREDILAQQAH